MLCRTEEKAEENRGEKQGAPFLFFQFSLRLFARERKKVDLASRPSLLRIFFPSKKRGLFLRRACVYMSSKGNTRAERSDCVRRTTRRKGAVVVWDQKGFLRLFPYFVDGAGCEFGDEGFFRIRSNRCNGGVEDADVMLFLFFCACTHVVNVPKEKSGPKDKRSRGRCFRLFFSFSLSLSRAPALALAPSSSSFSSSSSPEPRLLERLQQRRHVFRHRRVSSSSSSNSSS